MKITLKADVVSLTDAPNLATIIVQTRHEYSDGTSELGSYGMITVPSKNAEKIAALINEQL